ncbi:MAG: glycosyltransferase family 87 protein, partial [Candidatus Sulfotelmatobacter sp.]
MTDAVHALAPSSAVLKPQVLTDFYPSWYATRELLLHHRDPYGAGINRDLQIAYYNRELDPSHPEEQVDQQRFVYPLYFTFFVAPIARLEFHQSQIVFWWILAVCAVVNVFLWLRFLRLRLSAPASLALFVLVLTSIPVIQNLSILQPFLLSACFIAAAAAAVSSGYLFVAGALLSVATIKPQICLLPMIWFALWTGSNWLRRRSLFLGFAAGLAMLIFTSEWLFRGWLMRYPGVLIAYAGYTKATSLLGT